MAIGSTASPRLPASGFGGVPVRSCRTSRSVSALELMAKWTVRPPRAQSFRSAEQVCSQLVLVLSVLQGCGLTSIRGEYTISAGLQDAWLHGEGPVEATTSLGMAARAP